MAGEIEVRIDTRELSTALDAIKSKLDVATRSGVNAASSRLVVAAVTSFNRPPAPFTRTGNLQRSIKASPIVSLGAGKYSVRVGPASIYARIQEFGGPIVERRAGWNAVRLGIARSPGQFIKRSLNVKGSYLDTVTIHPHPYFTPAVEKTKSQMRSIFKSAWQSALD